MEPSYQRGLGEILLFFIQKNVHGDDYKSDDFLSIIRNCPTARYIRLT